MLPHTYRLSYGNRSYKEVERLIENSKEVMIISPYIDRYYARFLLRHAKGKEIRVISSSISKDAKKVLAAHSTNRLVALAIIALVMLFLNALFQSLPLLYAFAIYLSFAAVYAGLLTKEEQARKRIKLKIPRDFVHIKLYIGDEEAVQGSANLTFSGMHKNIEQITITHDKNEIGRLKNEFEKLWKAD